MSRLAFLTLFLTFGITLEAFAAADLTLSTTASPTGAVAPGTTITATSTIRNNGPDAATNPTYSIQFTGLNGNITASNFQVVSKPAAFTCSAVFATNQGPTMNCTAPTLASGASGQFVVSMRIDGTSGQGSLRTFFTSDTIDPDSTATPGIAYSLIIPQADLTLSTTASPTGAIAPGTTITATSTIRNNGPDAATNPTYSIQFTGLNGNITASNFQVVSKPAAFTCSAVFATNQGPTMTCTAPTLASGASGQFVVSMRVDGTSGQGSLRTFFTSDTTDPDSTATPGIAYSLVVAKADLATATTASRTGEVPSGTTVTYTSAIRNDGPDAAASATFSIRFTSLSGTINATNIQIVSKPAELTCGNAVATNQGPTVTCTASSIAAGFTGQVVASAQVNGTSGSMSTCSAFTSATVDPDTNGLSNGSCVTNSVTAPPVITTGLACPSVAIVAGSTGTATVSISSAQGTPTTITLTSANTAVATVPANVVINSGALSATFSITGVSSGTSLITATPPSGFGTAPTCTATVQAAPTTAMSCPTAPVSIGTPFNGTISISAQQGSPTVFALSSSNTAVATVPANVTIPAGALSVPYTITTVGAGNATFTATPPNGFGAAPSCNVAVIAPVATTMSCPAGTLFIGSPYTGTITISAAQPTPTTVVLSSNNTAVVTLPANVTIPAGSLSAPYTITAVSNGSATITATPPAGLGTAQNCQLVTGTAVTVGLGGGSCPATAVRAGTTGTVTVSLSAPQGMPTTISLFSSDTTVARVPVNITIPAGVLSTTFTVTGVSAGTATITATAPATLGGASTTCSAAITAAGGPAEIPTLSPLTMAFMAIVLGAFGYFFTRA